MSTNHDPAPVFPLSAIQGQPALVQALLLAPSQATEPLWQRAQIQSMTLAELIAAPVADIHRV